ncbi:MAG: hypothetical protein ACJA0J_000280, partial [Bdellovibrionota bacterium]
GRHYHKSGTKYVAYILDLKVPNITCLNERLVDASKSLE